MLMASDRLCSSQIHFLNKLDKDDMVKSSRLSVTFYDEKGRKQEIRSKLIPTFPLEDPEHDVNMHIVRNGRRTNTVADEETVFGKDAKWEENPKKKSAKRKS